MINQKIFQLNPHPRGFHLITREVMGHLDILPENGLLHLFIQHTSAGLTINENADPSVLSDFVTFFERLAPEHLPGITHTQEGPDDMPAHIKASLVGTSITVPITKGRLNLGIWQGIYLCEFRNRGGARRLVATIYS
ncbi:MAG TPA: secondary thiamine-phosphate synthase enzyme YjbQ [Saprospiraceae bacterium]|nr:secondary thiamine-phosphate synthase enzyme YjbQ [Saprospiraceae bacterium]HRV86662.1 secondary thiamine-phosphate synthase enzyme YjbQ [Saprospiraceae bacterium]